MSSPTPPYQRMVEALRTQVRRGELEAGSRVPSTRVLARTWKVATATAAHALRVLAEEGTLVQVPRSGTFVAGRRIATAEGPSLSRARIVEAAVRIADAEGIAALSIRRLASELEAPAMSLYRHVPGKDALLVEMTEHILSAVVIPEPVPKGWRAQLERLARCEWRLFKAHPWLARHMHVSRPMATPSAMRFADDVFRALHTSRLGASSKLEVHILLHTFVQGMAVNLEAEAQAVAETGISEEDYMRDQEKAFAALAASGRYPYFAKMMSGIGPEFEADLDRLFELGLSALLSGLKPLVER